MTSTILPTSTSPDEKIAARRIGRFSVSEKLGTGSNGTVFLGHDPVIDRDVAIKILSNPVGVADKKQREQQFINEARAAGRLSHPNIVTIFDASTEGGTTFIAMEFLQGQDLRDLMAGGKKFDLIETVRIVCKVAEALAYAHEHGVIHRDIKPANIFILPNQQPKVLDFGIARLPNRVQSDNGQPGNTLFNNNVLGTPNYMSPEQALCQPVTAQTDIYSLGAVMYEMLTQRKPFQSNDIDKLLQLIAHKKPRPPSQFNPKVSDKLSNIVAKAMQKDPAARFSSAAEMADALQKIMARDEKLKRRGASSAGSSTGNQSDNDSIFSAKLMNWILGGVFFLAVIFVLFSVLRQP
jgi:eukaryotic-like serine/threonine-protein kinase